MERLQRKSTLTDRRGKVPPASRCEWRPADVRRIPDVTAIPAKRAGRRVAVGSARRPREQRDPLWRRVQIAGCAPQPSFSLRPCYVSSPAAPSAAPLPMTEERRLALERLFSRIGEVTSLPATAQR